MKNYFSYPFNQIIKDRLTSYYGNLSLEQHNQQNQIYKMMVKLERIEKLIKFNESDIVLDIGCSVGMLLDLLHNRIKKGVGIDISKSIISFNKTHNKHQNIKYYCFDGKSITSNEKYSKIVLLDILEHAYHPDELIKNTIKILNPYGRVIIEVPFTGWLSELLTSKYHQGHLRYYDYNYLKKYLNNFGLEVESFDIYNSVIFSKYLIKFKTIWNILDKLVNLVPPRFYPYFGEIVVVAKIS